MRLGRVISSEITENRDGEKKVLLLKVEISEAGDDQTVEYFQAAGVDYRPTEDVTVIITDLGDAYKIAIGADDGIEPEAAEGEHEIYAHQGGQKKGRLKCNLDNTVQAGAGDDFVAQSGKVDQFISDIYNMFSGWTPAPNDGGAALKTAFQDTFPMHPASVASSNLKGDD